MRAAEKLLAGHSRGRSCVCHQLDQGLEVANALGEEKNKLWSDLDAICL